MSENQEVRLERISLHNWQACIALSVADSQQHFVPSNLYSIAEAQFYPEACPLAAYNHADQMIGFALYGRDAASGNWKIFRLMIDQSFQGQGYGSSLLSKLIAAIASQPDAKEVLICYHCTNAVARQLYSRFGFREQSTDASGKTTAILTLARD